MLEDEKLKEVKRRTRNERPNFPLWMDEISGGWAELFYSVNEEIENDKLADSIIYMRIMELQKFLTLLESNMYSGFYYSTIRDLRYHLEAFVNAFYIDNKYSGSSSEVKNAALKELDKRNPTGLKLLNKHFADQIPKEWRKDMQALYRELCEYVHPSYSEWEKTQEDPAHRSLAMFNEKSFERTKKLTEKTFAATSYLIILHHMPDKSSNIEDLENLREQIFNDDKNFSIT